MPIIQWIVLGLAVGVATAVWNRLRDWASTTLADALGRIFGPSIRNAFLALVAVADGAVVRIQNSLLRPLDLLRYAILKASVAVERRTTNQYLKKLLGYVRKTVAMQEKIFRVVVEEEVPFDDLPAEIRERLLRGRRQVHVPAEYLTLQVGESR